MIIIAPMARSIQKLNPINWVFILWFYALKALNNKNHALASSLVRDGKTGGERIANIADAASASTIMSILMGLYLSTFRLTQDMELHWVELSGYVTYAFLFGIIYWLIIRQQRWKKIVLAYPVLRFAKAGVFLSLLFMFIVMMGVVFFS